MKVEAILSQKKRPVVTARPDETVKRAADRLRMENIAALVVIKVNAIVGLISEREIVRAFSRYGDQVSAMLVKDLMIDAVTCTEQDDLKRIMTVMTQRRARHIPVLRDGRIVGIISIGDVVKHRLKDLELEAGVMRDAYFAAR